MSQVIDTIVSEANAEVAAKANEVVLTRLESARQSAADKISSLQADLDAVTAEIEARSPKPEVEEAVETPAGEVAEAPIEEVQTV